MSLLKGSWRAGKAQNDQAQPETEGELSKEREKVIEPGRLLPRTLFKKSLLEEPGARKSA